MRMRPAPAGGPPEGGPPDAGMPRFEKEHLEELPAALRGAVGAELAGMLLDDCRGSAPTQLRHELRLLRQFLAAEADKLAALKELRRKAPSGDAWTEGQVTVQRVHEWTDTREHLSEWAVEGAAVSADGSFWAWLRAIPIVCCDRVGVL